MSETSREEAPTCEYIMAWINGGHQPVFCATVAHWRYPAMGGGYMHMCDEHAIRHMDYAEAIGMQTFRG